MLNHPTITMNPPLHRRHFLKTAALAAAAPSLGRAGDEATAPTAKPVVGRTRELMEHEPGKHLWPLHKTVISRTNLVQMQRDGGRHTHPDADHSFYVIRGEAKAWVGGEEIALAGGDFISIPAGVAHGYTVAAGQTALLISMDSPPYDPAKTVR